MRVSLNPARISIPVTSGGLAEAAVRPLLASSGARVILGERDSIMGEARPIIPARDTLFGPRGACLASPQGPLFVCDTGHHRLLIWSNPPSQDHALADFLIGQPYFKHEGRNAKGEVTASTLNVPTGVAASDGVLAVADAWNHRVLIWHGYPQHSNQPADVVLGQSDFSGGLANRGSDTANADTLNWCYGVMIANGRLFVADTGNRRVLMWNQIPTGSGLAPDLVLGQTDFKTRDENGGNAPGAMSMRWPHGMAIAGDRLLVADAGNNRVMVWNRIPGKNGAPCDFVLGQSDAASVDHNMAAYYPTAAAMNMPYGVTVIGGTLAVTDTANSRLLGFDLENLAMGASADKLAGQATFVNKGDNRWGSSKRDSLCWPYNAAACSSTLVIADSGNNRVLLWEAAS